MSEILNHETIFHSPKKVEPFFLKSILSENSITNNKEEDIKEDEIINNPDFFSSYNYYIYYNNIKKEKSNLPKPTYIHKNLFNLIEESKTKDNEPKKTINDANNKNNLDIISKIMSNLDLEENDSVPSKSKFDFVQNIDNNNNDKNNELKKDNNNNNLNSNDKDSSEQDLELKFYFNNIFQKNQPDKLASQNNIIDNEDFGSNGQNNIDNNNLNLSNKDNINYLNHDKPNAFNK